MRTSAGIFYRGAGAAACLAALVLLASCAAQARYQETYQASRLSPLASPPGEPGVMVASWYGPGFHGKLTASGEVYDMDAMTCAHKSLPMGTRLHLTNDSNGSTAAVTVNDRGPFVEGRELDLSRAAAQRLGVIGPGTALLKVAYLGRDERYVKYIKSRPGVIPAGGAAYAGQYTIQVGSYRERDNAEHIRMGLELNYRGRGVYVQEKWIAGERFYRVRVGQFGSRDEAMRLGSGLAAEGYDAWIIPFEGQSQGQG